MTAFRDAIMRSLHQATHDLSEDPDLRKQTVDDCDELAPEGWIGDAFVAYDLAADAILAMPEMEAIRAALWSLTYVLRMGHQSTDDARTVMAAHGLPESVIAWCLDGAK